MAGASRGVFLENLTNLLRILHAPGLPNNLGRISLVYHNTDKGDQPFTGFHIEANLVGAVDSIPPAGKKVNIYEDTIFANDSNGIIKILSFTGIRNPVQRTHTPTQTLTEAFEYVVDLFGGDSPRTRVHSEDTREVLAAYAKIFETPYFFRVEMNIEIRPDAVSVSPPRVEWNQHFDEWSDDFPDPSSSSDDEDEPSPPPAPQAVWFRLRAVE